MIENEKFERHLRGSNLSENTISSYVFAVKQYGEQYGEVTKKNLKQYKVWLIENYKPKTVNLRLRAINCYLESIGKETWKMPFVRVQQKVFLENLCLFQKGRFLVQWVFLTLLQECEYFLL